MVEFPSYDQRYASSRAATVPGEYGRALRQLEEDGVRRPLTEKMFTGAYGDRPNARSGHFDGAQTGPYNPGDGRSLLYAHSPLEAFGAGLYDLIFPSKPETGVRMPKPETPHVAPGQAEGQDRTVSVYLPAPGEAPGQGGK